MGGILGGGGAGGGGGGLLGGLGGMLNSLPGGNMISGLLGGGGQQGPQQGGGMGGSMQQQNPYGIQPPQGMQPQGMGMGYASMSPWGGQQQRPPGGQPGLALGPGGQFDPRMQSPFPGMGFGMGGGQQQSGPGTFSNNAWNAGQRAGSNTGDAIGGFGTAPLGFLSGMMGGL